jgi:hypothetical protein
MRVDKDKIKKQIKSVLTSNPAMITYLVLLIYFVGGGILCFGVNAIVRGFGYVDSLRWLVLFFCLAVLVQGVVEWIKYIRDNWRV